MLRQIAIIYAMISTTFALTETHSLVMGYNYQQEIINKNYTEWLTQYQNKTGYKVVVNKDKNGLDTNYTFKFMDSLALQLDFNLNFGAFVEITDSQGQVVSSLGVNNQNVGLNLLGIVAFSETVRVFLQLGYVIGMQSFKKDATSTVPMNPWITKSKVNSDILHTVNLGGGLDVGLVENISLRLSACYGFALNTSNLESYYSYDKQGLPTKNKDGFLPSYERILTITGGLGFNF